MNGPQVTESRCLPQIPSEDNTPILGMQFGEVTSSKKDPQQLRDKDKHSTGPGDLPFIFY